MFVNRKGTSIVKYKTSKNIGSYRGKIYPSNLSGPSIFTHVFGTATLLRKSFTTEPSLLPHPPNVSSDRGVGDRGATVDRRNTN